MQIHTISDFVSQLGEGPVYNFTNDELIWTDITGKCWFRHRIYSGETQTISTNVMIGALAFRKKTGYVAAIQYGFATIDKNGVQQITNKLLGDSERMNDGKCDGQGRFWAGSTNLNFEKGNGKLYRLDSDFNSKIMLDNLTLPNGMDWSPDNRYFYLIDSLDYKLYRFNFDMDKGSISKMEIFYQFDELDGIPDGLCVASSGQILVAMYDGGSILVISEYGELEQKIELPVKRPTSCTFVGQSLDQLIITSSFIDKDHSKESISGKTLVIKDLGLKGKKANLFDG